jgi:hypothetical protein
MAFQMGEDYNEFSAESEEVDSTMDPAFKKAVKTVFVWHANGDACPVCRALNGYEWHDTDIFEDVLWYPMYGAVYNIELAVSLTHGGMGTNCRCVVEAKVDYVVEEAVDFSEYEYLLGAF